VVPTEPVELCTTRGRWGGARLLTTSVSGLWTTAWLEQNAQAAGRATLFTDARTANTFAPTPVSDAELSEIWDLARWAPTSANTQPLRILYVRPGPRRDRLVPHMNEGNRDKTASAPAVAVLAIDTRFHEHIPTLLPFRPELKDVFATNEAMRTTSGMFNTTLQAGYFILSIPAHGFAAGPMSGFDAAGIDADSSRTPACVASSSSISATRAPTPGSNDFHAFA